MPPCPILPPRLDPFLLQSDTVKEQVTRVLLERLIVNRPHPWVRESYGRG